MKFINYFYFLLFLLSCTSEEQNKAQIQGTWKGAATYKLIREIRTYNPLLGDSLTRLVDTTIILQDVVMNADKEDVRLYGFKGLSSAPYRYRHEGDQLIFQKGIPANLDVESTSFQISTYAHPPSGNIQKLDADSLVLQLAILSDTTDVWKEYVLKLKRK